MKPLPSLPEVLPLTDEKQPPMAPFELLDTVAASGRMLHLRHWWPVDTPKHELPAKGHVLLLVHGLGGTTGWMSSMAAKLLEHNPRVYGLELTRIGQNDAQYGHVDCYQDLVQEIADAIHTLAQKHDGPVYVVGLSLGGLIVSHLAVHPPKFLAGVVLISPAYAGARQSFPALLYVEVVGRFILEKARLLKPKTLPLPYSADLVTLSSNPENRKVLAESQNKMVRVTAHTYMEILKMTLAARKTVLPQIQLPVLMFATERDTVCCHKAMIQGFQVIPSRDKSFYLVPGALHDIVLDPAMPAVADRINHWIGDRLERSAVPVLPATPEVFQN